MNFSDNEKEIVGLISQLYTEEGKVSAILQATECGLLTSTSFKELVATSYLDSKMYGEALKMLPDLDPHAVNIVSEAVRWAPADSEFRSIDEIPDVGVPAVLRYEEKKQRIISEWKASSQDISTAEPEVLEALADECSRTGRNEEAVHLYARYDRNSAVEYALGKFDDLALRIYDEAVSDNEPLAELVHANVARKRNQHQKAYAHYLIAHKKGELMVEKDYVELYKMAIKSGNIKEASQILQEVIEVYEDTCQYESASRLEELRGNKERAEMYMKLEKLITPKEK